MGWITENFSGSAIQSFIEKIITAGELSRRDHLCLTSTILADYKLTEEDRSRISRVLDYVQTGRLKLVD